MKKTVAILFLFLYLLSNEVLIGHAASRSGDGKSIPDAASAWSEFIPPLPSTNIPNDNPSDTNAVDPRQYGAKVDGITDDAAAIQQAIDNCAQNGGGIVVLKKGIFLSSPLVLKTGVYLKVEASAVLKAVPYADYPGANEGLKSKPAPLIGARNASHIGVFANGTIDGNGQDWWRTQGWQGENLPKLKIANAVNRPYLVNFINSSDIIVKDVTLQNSAQFNLVPQNCDNVVIAKVTIHNPANSHNTDGIDPSGSNIFIDGCTIDTGDDNIAIKGHNGPTKNVYITNCTFYHGHGLSIGSDFERGVENVYAQNIAFINTETGIRIKSARDRGGLVNNIHYSNLTMKNVGQAIEFTGYYPKIPPAGEDTTRDMTATTPRYQNITISEITATAEKAAGAIVGLPESLIQGVTLNNVTINAPKGLTVRNAQIVTSQTTIQTINSSDYLKEENSSIN
jgi:polygalacturonase